MVTFAVDDVTPTTTMLPSRPLGEAYRDALAIGGDAGRRVLLAPDDQLRNILAPTGVHPLLDAIGRAFVGHHPLVLSPDAVWLTIAQGVAQHVRLNAETLRPTLVGHQGRQLLQVQVNAMPAGAQGWQEVVAGLAKQLEAQALGADLFACDFSTSTEVERMAGHVIMLDTYAPYFSYQMIAICGIPTLTLTGNADDWRKIRDRVDRLQPFGLDTWCRSLRPIADQFVRAATGDVDVEFWRRIYNPLDTYGGEMVTGWATRFYPYIESYGRLDYPNPMLELPIDEPRGAKVDADEPGFYKGPGISAHTVPATLAKAAIQISDLASGRNSAVALHAGLVGVTQNADGALQPIAGWLLADASTSIDVVIDRIIAEHETTAPGPAPERSAFSAVSDELNALHLRLGSASLFGGALRLLPRGEQLVAWDDAYRQFHTVAVLPDGRHLVQWSQTFAMRWAVCRIEPDPSHPNATRGRLLDDPADIRDYGTSLAMLLTAALDHDGDLTHLALRPITEVPDDY